MVKFIEKSHRYLSDEGELTSVSKFFDRFKEKVDWKLIAKKSAKKLTDNGIPTTTADVLNKWEAKRDFASKVGTMFHSMKEQELIDTESPEFYDTTCSKIIHDYADGMKLSMPINSLENSTVYPELMIYDYEHMICGQADKVIIANNKINIWDFKTDKDISFKAYSSQWVKPRKLLKPLGHLDDANGNHYNIKMSLYMYMLWKANNGRFKPGELVIEHVHLKRDPELDNIPVLDENGQPIVLKTEIIKLPYLKNEVMAMLKTLE